MDSHELDLEICDYCSIFSGDDPDNIVYKHSKVILRGGDDEYFYADVPESMDRGEIDIRKLNIIKIPEEHIRPLVNPKFTRVPESLLATCYQKLPNLLSYDGDKDRDFLPTVILNEVEVCEILREHPHPNIARYLGCIVQNGRIKALGFDKYPVSLEKMLEDEIPFDKARCISGIEAGVQHMHGLGLVHNDLNPSNIMMDGDDPIIIDFDSCRPEGEKLLKGGTYMWSANEFDSKRSNDHYSLMRIREAFFDGGGKAEGDREVEEHQKPEESKEVEGVRRSDAADGDEREDDEDHLDYRDD